MEEIDKIYLSSVGYYLPVTKELKERFEQEKKEYQRTGKKLVIAFIGKARHGKDTMVIHTKALCKAKCEHVSFAKHLKEQAKALGWDGEKDFAGRNLLQALSRPVKNYYNEKALDDPEHYGIYGNDNYYSAIVLNQILNSDNEVFFLSDMRFLCEYNLFKSCKDIDFKVVLINRLNHDGTEYDNGLTEEQKNHPSELEHLQIPYDLRFDIVSIEDSMNASEIVSDLWLQ